MKIISVDRLTIVNKTAIRWDPQKWRVYFFNRSKSSAVQDHVQLNTCTIVSDFHCPFWLSLYFNSSLFLGYGEVLQRAWTCHHDPWKSSAILIFFFFKKNLYDTLRENFTLTYDGKEEDDAKNLDCPRSHCRDTNAMQALISKLVLDMSITDMLHYL